MLAELADGKQPAHPTMDGQGFWRLPNRHTHPASPRETDDRPSGQPLLIVGSTGTLGRSFAIACRERGLAYDLVGRREMDITNSRDVWDAIDRVRPWAVINAAGYVRVDDAEREPSACFGANTTGAVVLAAACAERRLPYVTFSSDLVFDGSKCCLYVEGDPVNPLNVYGQSKADAERWVLCEHPDALVIRTSAFFSPWDDHNFVTNVLRALTAGQPVSAADDAIISPTYVPDLVDTALDLLVDDEHGRWHLTNDGSISWADLARQAAGLAGLPDDRIVGCPTDALGLAAPRPRFSALGTERAQILPSLDDALSRYIGGTGVSWQT